MDGLYRGMETGLLGLGLILGLAAFLVMATPQAVGSHLVLELPMLSVTAEPGLPAPRP